MARIKYFLSIIFVIVAVVCFLVFYFRNATAIPVDLVIVKVESLGIGFWILTSFVVGSILGWLVSWPSQVFLKVSKRSKEKRLSQASTELARIKSTVPKGS